jgi:hypothetical protein
VIGESDGDAFDAADGDAGATEGETRIDPFGEVAAVATGDATDGVDPPHAAADRATPEINSAIHLFVRSTSEPSLAWDRRAVPALRVWFDRRARPKRPMAHV